jgi:hypothetical protein
VTFGAALSSGVHGVDPRDSGPYRFPVVVGSGGNVVSGSAVKTADNGQ